MPDLWRETYSRLAGHPDFLHIWQEDGPIRERVETLEKKLRDSTVTDPIEIAGIKAELNAYSWLRRTLEEAPRIPEKAEPKSLRLRRTVRAFTSSLLPRPLG